MKKVILSGWRVGLKKISLTKLILSSTNLSLRESKNIVDELTSGKEMEVEVHDHKLESFLEEGSSIGVIFKDSD